MAKIQLKHVYKEFDDGVVAVSDFHLDIEDKEFVIFVGPSGCGKSTTLRMIAGLEKITQGELLIDGKRMNDVEPCDRDIAMVFQNYALYPHMTVFQNMAYSLRLKKVPKAEQKRIVGEAAKILGLETLLDRKPKELSGGQKQRVAMGRAIVRNPKVFLMDEPLSNLDAKLRNQMRSEILKLYQRLNNTFIYVTHDQTEAMTLGTKIVVMRKGEIQQVATPEELYRNPANVFVAGFIGNPPMNFFDGKVVTDGEKTACLRVDKTQLIFSDVMEKHVWEKRVVGEEVIIGVRPEDILFAGEEDEGIPVTITVKELLGAESYLYFDYQDKSMSMRARADIPFERGDQIRITFRREGIHLFDAYKETRI